MRIASPLKVEFQPGYIRAESGHLLNVHTYPATVFQHFALHAFASKFLDHA